MKRNIVGSLVLFIAQLLVLESAQAFPDRPIKLVVPSPAGALENRPGGAGGTIGAKSVVTAEPDGHTILIGSTSALLIAPLVHKSAGYSSETFAPVAGLSETTEVLAVHPSVSANSVADLVQLAKSQPGGRSGRPRC